MVKQLFRLLVDDSIIVTLIQIYTPTNHLNIYEGFSQPPQGTMRFKNQKYQCVKVKKNYVRHHIKYDESNPTEHTEIISRSKHCSIHEPWNYRRF